MQHIERIPCEYDIVAHPPNCGTVLDLDDINVHVEISKRFLQVYRVSYKYISLMSNVKFFR